MERLRIGDRVRVIHKGKKEDEVCTILDILEDYGDYTYWLRNDKGNTRLESETLETIFEKVR